MNNPHWKAIMLLFSNSMRLNIFHAIFCWRQHFFIDFRKNTSCCIIQSHSTPFDIFGIVIGYQCIISHISVCKSLKKLKNEGSTMFRGSAIQKLEEKCFSVKIWIIIKKICSRQQKMNCNYPIFFLHFERQ